ncbi:FMN-binding protein, partial [Clostridium sp. SHJSY1]|uniref:FMN-binding protein n=1 Tax=Clostridium sp. SHJSY1 TaxID=2942483 RepID=UPI002875E839
MLKKIKKMQIFRHIIQLIMFILSPGLYILAFSEFKKIYQMIINGKFVFVQVFPTLIEFISVILITMLLGRFFCGWVCTFGAYNDFIHLLSKKVFKVKFKVNEKVDSVLKYMKFVVLFILMVVSWTIGSNIFNGTSPWDAFAQITDFSYVITNLLIGFILLTLITIGAFFVERFFCRYLCPLGAIFTVCSRVSLFKINKPGEKCGKCRMCTTNCSMGLPLYTMESVRGGECINCLKCLEVCPRKNTKGNIIDQDITLVLASSIAIATFAGVYGLTNFTGKVLEEKGITASADMNNAESKYKDGTYIGTGKGFRGGTTTISVTISQGKIASIETVSQEDTPDFYEKAIGVISKEILSAQSTEVDVVSGATYSSNGIIEAVENALSQALLVSEVKETNNSDSNKTVNNAGYKDGTYTGVGTGFNGATTKLAVTISDGKISNMETVSSGDTPDFYDRAIKVISKEILSSQSTEVDIVSGATYSSKGIIEAVRDALNQASGKPASDKESKVSENDNHNVGSNKTVIIDGNFADGTYTGVGTGFNGATTKVSVTIRGGKIATIDTISNGDTPEFYERASKVIPGEIISTQSTSVDVVSGATYSSKGIIQAVEDALSKASTKFKATIKPVSSGSGTNNGNNDPHKDGIVIEPNTKFKDGTYTGIGTGFMGAKTNISVIISGGKIINIQTISQGDTASFYERAIGTIANKIISAQSTSVDVVSGATYSSKGIIAAVNDALSKAVINQTPTSELTPELDKGYKDGAYTGTGIGFRGAITKISVTVSGGKVAKIETVSHGDTPRFYEKTIGTITKEIMEKQSTKVDVVSGAT